MHISACDSYDQNIIHNAFIEDLERQLEKNNIQPSFIFFTGDVAYTASPEDYELAEKFFERLCNTINFDKRQLFIVPGNHDVNRYKVSKLLDDKRNDLCTREEIKKVVDDTSIFNSYLSRFDNYSNFISQLYGISYYVDSTNYYFAEKRQIENVEYGIIGLNSAWSSYGGRQDCNNIYISEKQVRDAIEKVKLSSIKIVLLHHPLSWIYEEDRVDIENLLHRHCDIILHGHLHRPDFQVVNSLRGQQIIIPAGAIYTGRRISNSYNITVLDSEAGTIMIIPRRYYDGPGKFLSDVESLGTDESSSFVSEIPRNILMKLK
jgi:predicted phosphodiesterase